MRLITLLSALIFTFILLETTNHVAHSWFIGTVAAQSSSVPTGGIILIDSGTCPSGFTEVAGFDAHVIRGTIASNGDVGGTGGNDSYTPAGTVAAPTFTGSSGTVSAHTISWPAGVPTFAGDASSAVINHTHTATVTDPGHVHVQSVNSATSGGLNGYGVDTSTNTSSTSGYSTASATTGITVATSNPASGVGSITPTGSIAWPAGVPTMGTVSFTPAGTNSAPAFTGTGATVIPSYLKLIGCKKT